MAKYYILFISLHGHDWHLHYDSAYTGKVLTGFGYYVPKGREVPDVTKAAIDWMNTQLGPEDIELMLQPKRSTLLRFLIWPLFNR